MRILVTIPHYYRAGADDYASAAADPGPKITALDRVIRALHTHFSAAQCQYHEYMHQPIPLGKAPAPRVDVFVVTTGGEHLLRRLETPASLYGHLPADVPPPALGFACHAMFAQAVDRYDYFCFLEDDIVLTDPDHFAKLRWFTRQAGTECLLQPHRYETPRRGDVRKLYLDGPMPPEQTAPLQNIHERPELSLTYLDRPLVFQRASNPHAGCFFLSREQLRRFMAHPAFLDQGTEFIGPLETAATGGIMRAFRVYKTAPYQAQFLEVEHAAPRYYRRLERTLCAAPATQKNLVPSRVDSID